MRLTARLLLLSSTSGSSAARLPCPTSLVVRMMASLPRAPYSGCCRPHGHRHPLLARGYAGTASADGLRGHGRLLSAAAAAATEPAAEGGGGDVDFAIRPRSQQQQQRQGLPRRLGPAAAQDTARSDGASRGAQPAPAAAARTWQPPRYQDDEEDGGDRFDRSRRSSGPPGRGGATAPRRDRGVDGAPSQPPPWQRQRQDAYGQRGRRVDERGDDGEEEVEGLVLTRVRREDGSDAVVTSAGLDDPGRLDAARTWQRQRGGPGGGKGPRRDVGAEGAPMGAGDAPRGGGPGRGPAGREGVRPVGQAQARGSGRGAAASGVDVAGDMLPHRRRRAEQQQGQQHEGSAGPEGRTRAGAGQASATATAAAVATAAKAGSGSSAGATEAASGAADEDLGPTFVPRNPGVSDGQWDKVDTAVVKAAQLDAQSVALKVKDIAGGEVLLGHTAEELGALAVQHGEPKFRGKQLLDALLKGARSLDDVTTVPMAWREHLASQGVRTGRSVLHHQVRSTCGTRKFLLQLADGRVVETVGIPIDEDGGGVSRLTVCVSSQVGCPMRCTFCATGKGGFARSLAPHEIVDQVLTVQEQFGHRVSNVVFMGMGEPLLNLPSVVKSYHLLNQQLGIGARSITISTVGVPNAIRRLAAEDLRCTLAVSIHAPTQELRETIVPSAKAFPLPALMRECVDYYQQTGRRVTFEYTLLSGVNDGVKQAGQLATLLRCNDLVSHVNLIPWNPVDESEFKRPAPADVKAFVKVLEAQGIAVSVRQTRGLEAAAACGQLRNRHQKEPLSEFAVPA